MLRTLTLVTLLLTIVVATTVYSQAPDPKTITIAEARALPLGTVVTIFLEVNDATPHF